MEDKVKKALSTWGKKVEDTLEKNESEKAAVKKVKKSADIVEHVNKKIIIEDGRELLM